MSHVEMYSVSFVSVVTCEQVQAITISLFLSFVSFLFFSFLFLSLPLSLFLFLLLLVLSPLEAGHEKRKRETTANTELNLEQTNSCVGTKCIFDLLLPSRAESEYLRVISCFSTLMALKFTSSILVLVLALVVVLVV